MADVAEQSLQNLNDCGCCEGLSVETPVELTNAPGLSAIAYRVGTQSRFKQSMLARLSDAQQPELAGLTTRSDDDFAIALLDAWAVVADILTFYQERIANESYLRTATERRSILELARSIGYELRPGVAASAYLAFTVEGAVGAPGKTAIGIGTRVQSIPLPGQQAQTFETIAPIPAWAAWNAMTPRLTTRHPFKDVNKNLLTTFFFDGISTNLKGGDVLIIVPDDDNTPVFCQIIAVTPEPDQQRTQVDLQTIPNPSRVSPYQVLALQLIPAAPFASSTITSTFFNQTVNAVDLNTTSLIENFSLQDVFINFLATQTPPPGVLTFRTRAAVFGHNAPRWEVLPYNLTNFEYVSDAQGKYTLVAEPYQARQKNWADVTLDKYPIPNVNGTPGSSDIYLDTTYPAIAPSSYIVLRDGSNGTWGLHFVQSTADQSVADFTLSAKVTKLSLDDGGDFGSFGIRSTAVFGQSEQLTLARLPILDTVGGPSLDIESVIDGLYVGQALMVCGELDQNRGNTACEYVTLQDIEYHNEDEGFTRVTFVGLGLQNVYVRNTVTINGNIAPATHGETRQEVLGSGDGGQSYQQFTLHQSPLTYISAAGPGGVQSSLQVYVNDIQWHEVPAFYGHSSNERIYITHNSNEGQTTIEFGNGVTGSRLPTGQQNVRAVYRTGIGEVGLVKANQLTLLLTRPAGVKGVTNPQDASGAADPEVLDDARQNAPLPVLTLGRIVSLRDYEDFTRAFAGIAKALATWTWDGQRQGVFLTVAGPQGAAIDSDSPLYTNLLTAIQQAGDPFVPVRMQSYIKRFFRIVAVVKINPDYLPDDVASAIETALRTQFSFDARTFGQFVSLSEVIAAMQSVSGVVAVIVNALYRSYPIGQEPAILNLVLPASVPQIGGSEVDVSAAELLTLDPAPLNLTITV